MNWFKAVTVSKLLLLILCTVLLFAIALLGTPDIWFMGSLGVFEDGAITLGLDLNGGSIITYEAVPQDGKGEITSDGMKSVEEVMRRRLDNLGYTEALVYIVGDNCIRIEIPGISNPTEAVETIGSTAKLSFTDYSGKEFMTGENVDSARATYNDSDGDGIPEWFVALNFDGVGANKFAQATEKAASLSSSSENYICIYLDGQVISQASVKEKIEAGSAVITGDFDQERASELAALINGGSLPYDLLCDGTHGSLSSVAASLGERSLETSLIAGAIGLGLVIIFMIIMYRFPGVVSALALAAYTAIMAILLIVTKANLTLPGIAGIILGIGMAVDANVVIFERIKEEIRSGKSTAAAVKSGFSNALSAVIDSNITTLIAAGVLWFLGSGSIQGFAVTLFLSVCISMVTAVFVTKAYLKIGVDLGITKISAYGVKHSELSSASEDKVQ
jgi:protein-export membrane protein SecD